MVAEAREIPIRDESDIVVARSIAKTMAKELGFSLVEQTKIATVISELARNVVVHSMGEGVVNIRKLPTKDAESEMIMNGLEIITSDNGIGITDIATAQTDGYTSGGGLGLGLGGARRLMDEFELESQPGKGTTICVRKWI